MPQLIEAYFDELAAAMDPAARSEFDWTSRYILKRSLELCGLSELPEVWGDPNGTLAGSDCVCELCGQTFFAHPLDWRVIGYGNVPFLNILCDGQRVKL